MTSVGAEYREPDWFRTLACVSPLGVLLVIRSTTSWGSLAVFVTCLVTLILSALWLGYAVFLARGVRLAFAAAALLLCLGWGWQGSVYMLLPGCSLKFGHFLTPSGHRTGLALFVVPVLIVSAGLLVSLILGLRVAWQTGRRWSLLAMLEWWLMATIVFLLPDIYLSLQGYGVDF